MAIGGTVVSPPAFVVNTAALNRTVATSAPATVSVDFSSPYLATSVAAGDLLVDGSPLATGVVLASGTSLRFTLPQLPPGSHTYSLADGSLQDIHGTPLTGYSFSKYSDDSLPKVLATSLTSGGNLPPGTVTYQVTFSEPMNASYLTIDDFQLRNAQLGTNYVPTSYSFDPTGTILTLKYANFSDGQYSLTLISGAIGRHFADMADNPLDGEFRGVFPSGDGADGGNFAIRFAVDTVLVPFPSLTPQLPSGSLIYSGKVNSNIEVSGDVDRYSLALDAGQTITVQLKPSDAKLQPIFELRDANDSVLASATAATAGTTLTLQTLPVTDAETYFLHVRGAGTTAGYYALSVTLNAAVEIQKDNEPANNTFATAQDISSSFIHPGTAPDGAARAAVIGNTGYSYSSPAYYAFTLGQGDSASITINGLNTATVDLQLYSPTAELMATAEGNLKNVTKAIRGFVATTSGTYFLYVNGRTNADYTLVVTKNSKVEIEPNDSSSSPQLVSHSQWLLGSVRAGDADWFRTAADIGSTLLITSSTPSDGPGEFNNALDPHLELYDDTDTLVASGIPLADGRNETIEFQPKRAGTFGIRVVSEGTTAGDYTLQLAGNLSVSAPFQATFASPLDGIRLNVSPTDLTVNFSTGLLVSSIQKEDLLIDGIAVATGFSLLDGDSLDFSLPPLSDGLHTAAFAVGTMQDLQGTPLAAASSTFTIDATPPKVVSTSVLPGGTASPGSLTYQVVFSEPVMAPTPTGAITLKGATGNKDYYSTSSKLDATGIVLTVKFQNLPEDKYTLTVLDGAFAWGTGKGLGYLDIAGNLLDGEFKGTLPTGDGKAGGNFVATFTVDAQTEPFPPLQEEQPVGSLIYDGSTLAKISPAGDTDSFTFPASAGQRISVLVTPSYSTLNVTVELRDPTGALVGQVTGANSRPALLETIAATMSGTYKVTVSGGNGMTGPYTVALTLNAALDIENNTLSTNNTIASAQNIDSSAVSLGGGASRFAVMGSLGSDRLLYRDDFENGLLPASFTTYRSTTTAGRITLDKPDCCGNPSGFALAMDSGTAAGVLEEAVEHVNLAGVTRAYLSFSYDNYYDFFTALPTDFVDHANGDGVSISTDGTHWHSVFQGTSIIGGWKTFSVDLAAAAAAAGFTLGGDLQIKFQRFGRYSGIVYRQSYDDIQVTSADDQDVYQLTLSAGDSLTVAARSKTGGLQSLQLLDATGAAVAAGSASQANVDLLLADFVAPTSGSYYVALKGTSSLYSLIATRNAVFDTRTDHSATSQSIGTNQRVLGHVESGIPLTLTAIDAGNWNNYSSYGSHYSYQAGQRSAGPNSNNFVGQSRSFFVFDLAKVNLPVSAATLGIYNPPPDAYGSGYYSSDSDETYSLFDVSTPISDFLNSTTSRYPLFDDLGTGTVLGSQVMSSADNGQIVPVQLNAAGLAALNAARPGLAALGGADTTLRDVSGGNLPEFNEFVFYGSNPKTNPPTLQLSLGSEEDSYLINVTSTSSPLVLTTTTPSDGSGHNSNSLDPHIELYSPSNVLVASGIPLDDGRNESIVYQQLVPGVYRVRVTAEGATSGDYILNRLASGPFLSLASLTVDSPISEGGTTTLRGIYFDADPASSQVITIDWGRSSGPGQPSEGSTILITPGPNPAGTTVTSLGAGVWQFTATHSYLDDAPAATANAVYNIGVNISDNHQIAVNGSTTVTVSNVAPVPAITVPTGLMLEGRPITVQGLASDVGGPAEQLTLGWKIFKDGYSVPFATGGNSSSFTFTPDNHGSYRVELTASDDDGGVATASQTLTVANIAPLAGNLSSITPEDTPVTILLKATDSPADLAILNFRVTTPPQHGTLTGVSPNVIYTPAQNYNGPDSFTFDVTDGLSLGNVATVFLNVTAVNDPPTFKALAGNYIAFDENPDTKGPALQRTVPLWATNLSAGPSDETGQSMNFIVTIDNDTLFAVRPAVGLDGTLSYKPLPNAHGIAHVTVVLHDSGNGANLSAPVNFTIEIKKPHPLHNAAEIGKRNGLDVTGSTSTAPDGKIAANDAVAIINYINAHGGFHTQDNSAAGPPYCDVTDDDQVGADDVIAIINYMNSHPGQSEAPFEPAAVDASPSVSVDLMNLLAADSASEQLKRRRLMASM